MSAYDHSPPDLATQFRRILSISKEKRTLQDADIIYGHLREIQAISKLPESELRQMAKHARYEVHESNETMYCAGHIATCWYILLSGSAYLNGFMYLPGSCFGHQTDCGRRIADCLILEHSEMIVIDYPAEYFPEHCTSEYFSTTEYHRESYDSLESDYERLTYHDSDFPELHQVREMLQKSEPYLDQLGKLNRSSHLQKYDYPHTRSQTSLDNLEWDLSGMKETIVGATIDSDEDDEILLSDNAVVRDIVRDCLEKEPTERTENDIHTLMDFMQNLPAFSKLSHNIKVEMCKVMVFAVVDTSGAVVMSDKEEMDSWSVILNGSVEILINNQPPKILTLGDAFGVNTTPGVMYHEGTMKTRVDDCQFVCIAQNDYWRIFSQGEASCRKVEEEGEVVMVTEHRVTDGGSRQGQVVIKGTPERLLDHLMEDHSVIDPTYVEDFLLTFVVFFNKAHEIIKKLLKWFDRPQLQDKVTRVMLLWVNNHYCDFEGDSHMEACMERFEYLLESKKMLGQLRLLNMACSAKSKPRIITLQRVTKESKLDFSICGGKDRGYPIFVSQVNYDSKAYELGLKRGDEIIECNGQPFENITGQKAIDLLTIHTHLCLIVKSNSIGFKETSASLSRKGRSNYSLDETALSSQLSALDLLTSKRGSPVSRSSSDVNRGKHVGKPGSTPNLEAAGYQNIENISGSMTLPRNNKFKRAMMKLNIMPRATSDREINKIDLRNENGQQFTRYFTRPPDKASQHGVEENKLNANEDTMDLNSQVIKVYRGDHTSRFFVLTKDTIAKEVICTAIDAFGITDSKIHFLCEVTVTEDGLIKQKRLPDVANNLANRISLNGRYYIKSNISEGPISDEVALEISREANLTLLQLSPLCVAKELTLQDFELFRNVDHREYIYNLFEEKNERKSKNLRCVEQTTNTEMFWVISEICSEHTMAKRVKLLKYYIKVAKLCKDFKNYNSMYAIISGLANSAVQRLKNTWEKLPQKSEKLFNDLQELMDPSRNMSKYRNLFTGERCYPPVIPWFPIVKKDITFLHLGNDTYVDGLINFEKLRMIAREVRKICKYCNIGYDPYKMDALEEQGDAANVALTVVSISNDATNRRSSRGGVTRNNPKKAYEEFQTCRRIKQYLERLSARQYTEKELQEMSYNCEPPATINTPASNHRMKKLSPSPSPTVVIKNIPAPVVVIKNNPPPAVVGPAVVIRNKEEHFVKPTLSDPGPPPIPSKEPEVRSAPPTVPTAPPPKPVADQKKSDSSSTGGRKKTKHTSSHASSRNGTAKPSGTRSHQKKHKDQEKNILDSKFDDDVQVSMV